jgi:hypothetical protein
MKKHIFSSNLFKNEDFFKNLKTNDYVDYLVIYTTTFFNIFMRLP